MIAPKGIKDTSDFDESKSQGVSQNENLCDGDEASDKLARQRTTLDATKGPLLVETGSSKKENSSKRDEDNLSYDLFKQRQELQ